MKTTKFQRLKEVLVSILKNSKHDDSFGTDITVKEFQSFFDTYTDKFTKTLNNNGKVYTLNLYKQLHDQSVRIVTSEEWSPISFHKSNKEGVSNQLLPILKHLRGKNYRDIRLILSVTRIHESIRLKAVLDLEPIIAEYEGTRDLGEFDYEFRKFLNESPRTRSLLSQLPKLKHNNMLIGRIRSGPNGQAILTAHYDSLAVIKDKELHNSIKEYNHLINQDWITSNMEWCASESSNIGIGEVETGKIALASERAGKTRLFAIVDFWTQNSLQSLHDWLMKILGSLRNDSTFDQDRGFERILSVKTRWMSSFDISKFTDRVPLRLQSTMLEYYTSRDLANCWERIVGKRSFLSGHTKGIAWKVGQPLGALSSWAACTLLHHHLIWYASYLHFNDHRPFNKYEVLGDDVVIWHKGVGKAYADLLDEIGVKINHSKSKAYEDSKEQPIFEFAKRVSVNGNEITGIPYDLLLASSKSIYEFTELINYSVKTKLINKERRDLALPDYLSNKGKQFLEILLWERGLGRPFWLLNRFGNAFEETTLLNHLRIEIAKVRLEGFQELIRKLDELVYSSVLENNLRQAGVAYSDMLIGYSSDFYHPIIHALNNTGMAMYETLPILESMQEYVDQGQGEELELPMLTSVEYLPLPYQNAYFERPGKRNPERLRKHSQLVLTATKQLQNTTEGFILLNLNDKSTGNNSGVYTNT